MKAVQMINIDAEKFREELRKRGLRPTVVSVELGRASTYLSQVCRSEKMPIATLKILGALYNIREEDIVPDVKTPEIVADATQRKYDDLYDTVYKAICDAFTWYANGGGR